MNETTDTENPGSSSPSAGGALLADERKQRLISEATSKIITAKNELVLAVMALESAGGFCGTTQDLRDEVRRLADTAGSLEKLIFG